jgi:hypothetical protein
VKSRISGKEAVYVARKSERRRPVKLKAPRHSSEWGLGRDLGEGGRIDFEINPNWTIAKAIIQNLRQGTQCGARTRGGTLCQRPAIRGKRCRLHGGLSDTLADDEGVMFATNVPGSPIQVMGRRDPRTGELCVSAASKFGRCHVNFHSMAQGLSSKP